MLSSDVQEIDQPGKHLVGFSIRASLNEIIGKKLGNKLRSELASREAEIGNKVGSGVYLVQVYEYAQNGWTADSPFTQVIAREVERVAGVPEGMTAHAIPCRTYASRGGPGTSPAMPKTNTGARGLRHFVTVPAGGDRSTINPPRQNP